MAPRVRKQLLLVCGAFTCIYIIISLYNASKRQSVLMRTPANSTLLVSPILQQCNTTTNSTSNQTCAPQDAAPRSFLDYARQALAAVHLPRKDRRRMGKVRGGGAPTFWEKLNSAPVPPLPNASFTEPSMVMLLSYQRSGSSFMGDLLDKNPSIFYLYEPLDAVYSALYGVTPGWSVPSDITGNSDGSVRSMPSYETEQITSVIDSLMHCNFNAVPTEVLLSQFWLQFWDHHTNILSYTKCLHKNRISIGRCHTKYLKRVCETRFGASHEKQAKCRDMLGPGGASGSSIQGKYKQCLAEQRRRAQSCFPVLQERCERSPVRGVKTVRATMEEAAILMHKHPNMKLLHLFRDPRPVMLSRLKHPSFRSRVSEKNVAMEAKFYCGIVDHDLHLRAELVKEYPDRVFEIIYEDFVRDPLTKAKAIYDFLGIDFAPEVKDWLTKSSIKSSNIAQAWKQKIKAEDQAAVEKTCRHLFQHGEHVWQL